MTPRHRPDLSHLPLPDPLLARQVLREMRGAMRAGFGFVRAKIDRAPLPEPVAAITGSVLRKFDDLAHQADATASTMMDGLLGSVGAPAEGSDDREFIAALRRILASLDARHARVSESAVREAMRPLTAPPDARDAALLMRRLLLAEAVQPAGPVAQVAIFAALLAHMQPCRDAATLSSSLAIAEAVTDEIDAAGSAADPLARLFAEFGDHV